MRGDVGCEKAVSNLAATGSWWQLMGNIDSQSTLICFHHTIDGRMRESGIPSPEVLRQSAIV